MRWFGVLLCVWAMCWTPVPSASAQTARCDIPREARDIWHCENGFVIGPENVIIRLPIPETDPEALYNAGVEAANRQDWRVAIAYFTAAHDAAPFVSRYMYNLGLAHARAGHHVAAIASLAQYLIAEPNAPNRRAIWTQIAELESATQTAIGQIFSSAQTAAETIPDVSVAGEPAARSWSLQILQIDLAMSGRLDQAAQLSYFGRVEAPQLQDWYLRALVDDGDSQTVRATPAPAERGVYPYQMYVEHSSRDFTVEDDTFQPISGIEPWELLTSWLRPEGGAQSTAASFGDRLNALEAAPSPDILQRVLQAASIGLHALVAGDLAAARRASQLADAYDEAAARCADDPVCRGRMSSAPGPSQYGWNSVFLRACLRADQGDISGGLNTLDAFASARLASANWPTRARLASGVLDQRETSSPDRRWRDARWSARYSIAMFLAYRGRPTAAEQLAAQLSPVVRAQFYKSLMPFGASLAANWNAADLSRLHDEALSSSGLTVEQRRPMEQLEYFRVSHGADGLAGVAYDPEWWVRHGSNSSNPTRQVDDLAAGAAGLARSLRRVHVAYQRAGGTWGQ